jgi:predicted nucleic acid-binding protein
VGDSLILETSFLIDLEREARRGAGRAQGVLEAHAEALLFITPTIAGEVAAGSSTHDRDRWAAFIAPFVVLPLTVDVAWHYGQADRFLRANGLLIGANDLWIAAAGIAYDMPVVTRNAGQFRRVPGLEVLTYG